MKLPVTLLLPCLATGFVAPVQRRANVVPAAVQPSFRTGSSGATTFLAALLNVDEGAARDVGSMNEWAATHGVQRADGFELTSADGLDWSVMTTQPLAQGSPVLYVPSSMILSSTRARQELSELGNVQDATDQLGRLGANDQIPQFCLFLKILLEYERGDQSPYFPWLNSLPRLFFNSVSMTEFCYECLPPLVFSLARIERVKFNNFCDVLQKVNGIVSEQTKGNKEVLKWAYNVVCTRCWGSNDEKQIVPMADMLNHGTETEVAISYDEEGNCNVYTTKDVPEGSPLHMSYGDPTNPSQLFATYGFLDESSPATFCKIMTIKPTPELKDIGYDFSRMLFYKDTGDISEEVWDVLLYQVLENNKEVQQAFYQAHMTGDAETKRNIHQHYFLETSTVLKKHVDTFLKQLDELSAKGVNKDINEHPRLPLILRHNEFVKSTFLNVKARLDPMVEQAAGQLVQ